jgi:3-oxocholest-4-en-26-oyl-CoA dehydrogenase alpha subunit
MNFALSPTAEQLRSEIRSALAEEWPPGRRGYRIAEHDLNYPEHVCFRRRLGRHGWFGQGIPEEYGGSGGGVQERYVVACEFAYHGLTYPKVAVNMVGPLLLAHGSESLKHRFLPLISRGELEFSQAYSEPGAGSDLAALRTAARLDGEHWVITGQKLYCSFIHRSEYVVVAARTDPGAERHRGISLLIVPCDSPGLTYTPLWGMGDIRTNTVYLDEVVVPRENVIGAEHAGWSYLGSVLSLERLISFGVDNLRPIVEDLLQWLAGEPDASFWSDGALQAELAEVVTGMEGLDALARHTLYGLEQGRDMSAQAAEVKVFGTELRQRLTACVLEALGPLGQLWPDDPLAPLEGAALRANEAAVMPTFGGGGNEILRDLIAKRRLSGAATSIFGPGE